MPSAPDLAYSAGSALADTTNGELLNFRQSMAVEDPHGRSERTIWTNRQGPHFTILPRIYTWLAAA